MLNYQLVGDNDYIFDVQGTILNNRGIDDIEKFMNLDDSVVHDYRLLRNIDKAIECLIEHIENQSKIFIMVDCDVDGYTSSSIVYQYIKMIDKDTKITWRVHEDKRHGISHIEIPSDVNLVIVPDAGSNDFDKHRELKENGIDVIVLDHHEIDKESEHAIVVNSQLGEYPNLNLSGAGIAYKFCKALDDALWVNYADYFLDLVALGNIADSMSMKELETRYYVQQGLQEINNEFLLALLRQQEYSTKGVVSIMNIAFYISPLINAVIRVGSLKDKTDMFKSFIGEKELVLYKPRGGVETHESLPSNMARRCTNTKARQNRVKGKIVESIISEIEENKLNENKVIFIHSTDSIESGLTGLVANQIAGMFKKPTIILNSDIEGNIRRGSARGYDKGELKDFKSVVLESNVFQSAKGHANAYGVELRTENICLVNESLNEKLKSYSFDDLYMVDFELKADEISDSFIEEISDMSVVWGKDVDEPFIAVLDIPLDQCDIFLLGKGKNTISINHNGISYVLFKTDEDVYNYIDVNKDKKLSVVGRANINHYKGETYPQIVIENFKVN
jgi:single-stranded-DNA-specific exonuclease